MVGKLFYLLLTVIGICCGSSHFTKSNYPDCNSSDIEFLDTCLLGKSVREALVKLNIILPGCMPLMNHRGYFGEFILPLIQPGYCFIQGENQ